MVAAPPPQCLQIDALCDRLGCLILQLEEEQPFAADPALSERYREERLRRGLAVTLSRLRRQPPATESPDATAEAAAEAAAHAAHAAAGGERGFVSAVHAATMYRPEGWAEQAVLQRTVLQKCVSLHTLRAIM